MNALSSEAVDAIVSRHHAVFNRPFLERARTPLIALAVVVYLCFAWLFFDIGATFSNGNWDIAGNYLADWINYEARPDI